MLLARFSQLKLRQQRTGPDIARDKITVPMDLLEEDTKQAELPRKDGILVPDCSTNSCLNTMDKNRERRKCTPSPRPSPTKWSDQIEAGLEFDAKARNNSCHGSLGNRDVSPLGLSHVSKLCPNSSRGQPLLSEELVKLCSDSPMSTFRSDSDNSSCLFADDSFLSSVDIMDDVFGDGNISLSSFTDTKSYPEHSKCFEYKSGITDKFENDVSKGAAIAGSPSKIRHKNQRVLRHSKSASFRFSPLKPLSGTRWYKAPSDSRLYEVRRRKLRDLNQAAADTITLPKRVLQFGECESKPNKFENDQRDIFVEKAKSETHAELATCRTETPESGYGSLNSTRQTPDLLCGETPVTRFSLRSQFPRAEPEHHVPSPNTISYTINTSAIPWPEKFDIVSRLFRLVPRLVKDIFAYLEPKDLVLFSSVSSQWRRICSSHSPTAKIRDEYLKAQEKAYQLKKENLPSTSSRPERHVTGPGTPLSSVQCLGTPTAASTPAKKTTTFDKFCQLGKQLKQGETLEKCKCGSPARIETNTRKASCSSVHCQLEFCIKCGMEYHGTSPCPSSWGASRARGPSIGSKKSKKNLRRHSRLSTND